MRFRKIGQTAGQMRARGFLWGVAVVAIHLALIYGFYRGLIWVSDGHRLGDPESPETFLTQPNRAWVVLVIYGLIWWRTWVVKSNSPYEFSQAIDGPMKAAFRAVKSVEDTGGDDLKTALELLRDNLSVRGFPKFPHWYIFAGGTSTESLLASVNKLLGLCGSLSSAGTDAAKQVALNNISREISQLKEDWSSFKDGLGNSYAVAKYYLYFACWKIVWILALLALIMKIFWA
jgi:hypothetical protein